MPFCPNCGKEVSEDTKFCPECGQRLKEGFTPEERQKYTEELKASIEEEKEIIVSTTDTIPGKKIVKVLGVVHGKETFLGGYLVTPEMAQRKLEKEAKKLGANAIVAMKIEEKLRARRYMSRHYHAYGTAVVVEDEK